MDYVFVRHGSTDNLETRRFQGWSPVPLSALGIAQARAAAARLAAEEPVTALYASPVVRTRQTAEIISTSIGVPVQDLEALMERMTPTRLWGVAHAECAEYFEQTRANRLDPDWGYEDEESARSVLGRAARVLEVMRSHEGEPGRMVLVTHGITLKLLVTLVLLGREGPDDARMQIYNNLGGPACCAFARFTADAQSLRLSTWNDIQHVEAIGAL